jgi:hypothetical protein
MTRNSQSTRRVERLERGMESMIIAQRFAAVALVTLLSGCATLGGLNLQAPRFEVADEQVSELRLLPPSPLRPLGGVAIRLHARVENPNPVGITLTSLAGVLHLEGHEAAQTEFPLGVPLGAGQSSVVPLEVSVSFANLPGLADVVGRAVTVGHVNYNLRGTARVDAGILGQPSFGPMNLLQGTVQARR